MKRTSTYRSLAISLLIAAALALIVAGCGGPANHNTNTTLVSPTATPDLCSSISDQMLVDMIYGQLIKDGQIFSQIKQINITAKSGTVTLYGWVSDKTLYARVIGVVENTMCVKKPVDVADFYDHTGNPTQPAPGCVPPLVRCGDICVPGQCAWASDMSMTANTTSKSPTAPKANTSAPANGSAPSGNSNAAAKY